MTQGLLLLAHGARDPRWAEPFDAIAHRLSLLRPDCRIEMAYLEFLSPNFGDAAMSLVRAGCTSVEVLPMFLGAGGHVQRDLPRLLEAQRALHPQVRWSLRGPAGESAQMIEALAQWAAAKPAATEPP